MPGGRVNRGLLEAFYQNPGDVYNDTKSEGAFETIAAQVDANWDEYAAHVHDTRYYTQAQIDARFIQAQSGLVVDGTLTYAKFARDVKLKRLYKVGW